MWSALPLQSPAADGNHLVHGAIAQPEAFDKAALPLDRPASIVAVLKRVGCGARSRTSFLKSALLRPTEPLARNVCSARLIDGRETPRLSPIWV
jgi:hypothetical protein